MNGLAKAAGFALLVFVATLAEAGFAAPAADAAGLEFFEAQVRPILVDHCYPCHSAQATKLKGGLALDRPEGWLTGGDTGPAITPGDVEKSLLIKAVRYQDNDLRMPPKEGKLAPAQIAALEEWVKLGAPAPATNYSGRGVATPDKARTHWAFQPVREPKIPEVRDHRWVRTPVDNFILRRLEAANLRPSPRADARTLIRRATFDLTGLPPSPGEVAAFASDPSPDAFAGVVDRLLASPRYGERWGRHWLDVARYADTKGYVFEEDRHYAYAYTYRDYVIRAFNEDLPYDQFLKQQIAADLLPQADPRALAALGYLTLGRRFVNNINDIIDDRIDVVCRGMMGLTVACARCHDHKFDPIPTRDYYSLYGVFASSMEPDVEPLLGIEAPAEPRREYEAEHRKRVAARDEYRAQSERELAAQLRRQSGDYLLAAAEAARETKPDTEALAHSRHLDPEMLRRWLGGLERWRKSAQPIFAPWFAFTEFTESDFTNRAAEVAAKFTANQDALLNPWVAAAFAGEPPRSLKAVAARYAKVLADTDQQWSDLQGATNRLSDPARESLRQILYADDAPANLPRAQFDRLYDVPTGQKLRELQRHIDELEASSPGAPPRAMALADRPEPRDQHIFIRGNSDNPGAMAPRQFLQALSGPDRKPYQHGSGRLELAEDIANRENPLTARVLVNRVWLYHFGAPLVATPSDFGLRSDPPANPELLDYLAARFVAGNWSLKNLHRLILLSQAYQQSSDERADCARVDPNNQLCWRMNRQRLDFEAMRDSLLAAAGNLDLTEGGHAVDITGAESRRRTVYGFVDRQNLPGLFRAFDFASPDTSSARRFYSTVPQQALFFMNSPFVIDEAKVFAARPGPAAPRADPQRLRSLYQWAYQRDPSRRETAWALHFLQAPPPAGDDGGATNWLFGYGEFDARTARVKSFEKLPYFDGHAFQGGPHLPDPKLGWVVLNASGGHPGNDPNHAAIRRWLAPRDGEIAIDGLLGHGQEQGDGVRGRIVSSSAGLLGEWHVHHDQTQADVPSARVHRGDTVDFVTDCFGSVDYDSFSWAPAIRYRGAAAAAARQSEWSAEDDFARAARADHPSLTQWQKLAQAILMSNEFVFVD